MFKQALLLLILLFLLIPLAAQSLFQQRTIILETGVEEYSLADTPIIHHSESVWADSTLLVCGIDYRIDYAKSLLIMLGNSRKEEQPAREAEIPVSPPPASFASLRVEFILVPPLLIKPLQQWTPQVISDSLFASVKRRSNPLFASDTKLDIGGSKTFAITFSDDQSFELKQSLYVNLSGELAKGVSIDAQLSDSESKLSPEGDSKELSSLDRVFIRIFGQKYELAMGDIDWEFKDTRYINYYSKFEGLNAWYQNKHFIQAAYSASSGKNSTINLSIVDGKQGPYYLRANDFQPGFIVVAGSEEIFVDGSLLGRGVDYSIDYAEGSVMFKRLISSGNNVIARFQWTDDYYPQSSYLNSSQLMLSKNLSLSHHFIWQQNDKNTPLLYNFTPADLDSLRQAGDNPAWGEGIFAVEPGTGSYLQRTSSAGVVYYEYAEQDSTANYSLVFSYVGFGKGDYEEFSPGKYRYAGANMGSWLPQKRLVAPTQQANLDLALNYSGGWLNTGMEAIGTMNDKNTFSSLADSDNQGAIAYAFCELPIRSFRLKLDHEQRSANSYLFGKYRDPSLEYDFATLDSADSLAQHESNLSLNQLSSFNDSTILLRYKDISGLYKQRALRFNSGTKAYYLLPALNFRSTVSFQDYYADKLPDSYLQYYQGDALWSVRMFKIKLESLYNLLESTDFGTSYIKTTPTVSFGDDKLTYTQLSYTDDGNKVKTNTWKTIRTSQTYTLRQMLNFSDQHLDLDFSHRRLQQPESTAEPKSNYSLMNLRSTHNFLKQAISLYTNYKLNQTEFYAKIRELQYVGNGLGVYDSTGVVVNAGDYDYVFITSANGSLSSEVNALVTVYLKPGNISKLNSLKRLQTDTTINLNEQSSQHSDWKSYIFYPGTVFNETQTIFGKQSLQQNLWLDIIRNRITGNLQYAYDRTLDQRYQTQDRSENTNRAAQLDIKGYNAYNTRLQANLDSASDSRYQSQTELQSFGILVQRNLATLTSIQTELNYASESGNKQDGSENYRLSSYKFSPTLRSVFMQKYRFSASFSLTRNFLSGSSYFSFLPQKRAGWIPTFNTSAIYRINSFSSVTLDYRLTDFPKEKSRQELKLEFKAEL